MYPVDERDIVVQLTDAPRPDVGAPLPLVLADDYRLLLAYLLSEPDPEWDGTYVNVISPDSEGMAIAVIQFQRPYAHMFGPPNDEAFSGHPLANRGLDPYAVFEVRHSSWIRQLERMNSVHRQHAPEWFLEDKKHFIFTFHDSTFECIAAGFDVQLCRGSMSSALQEMTKLWKQRPT
jgi:hypothetical protein